MSNTMIIDVADIKSDGYFQFDTSNLTDEERLYRVHIAKKNAPPASLIIGGNDENHQFIIANKTSNIVLNKLKSDIPFHQTSIRGDWTNKALQDIKSISRFTDSTALEDTYLKQELITTGINEKLRFIADTSSNALVSLYAMYQSKYENSIEQNSLFYQNYLKKWEANQSSYFNEFRKSLPVQNEHRSLPNIAIGIMGFVIGISLGYYIWVRRKTSKIKSLSIQERNIFTLLKQGKTNKDISNELNIGLSTVKSHVSNIYSKLGIKSRKDILDLD